MTQHTEAAVIVGVDGSESSLRAVDWAAAEALAFDCPLRIVHAFIWPLMRVPLGPAGVGAEDGGLRADAQRILENAVQRAKAAAPGVNIARSMPVGAPAPVLLGESKKARLVVVGCTGLGGFSGLLVGSTGVQLAAHAPCPVVVVRGTARGEHAERTPGPVVVGVDEVPSARAVLELGMTEAVRLRTKVDVVYVVPNVGSTSLALPSMLATMIDRFRGEQPDVQLQVHPVLGHPAKELIEAAQPAELLVVGSRGRGGFTGLLLGSVSQAMLHHAPCPVAVVPTRD